MSKRGIVARIALGFSVAFALCVFWNDIVVAADAHVGLAAWMQAFGVFGAVVVSGWLAQRQIAKQERHRVSRQVASTTSVIELAREAIDEIEGAMKLKFAGFEVRDPIRVLVAVHEALTPLRIHELPVSGLVRLAIEIKAEISEIIDWMTEHTIVLDMQRANLVEIPTTFLARIQRAKMRCDFFIGNATKSGCLPKRSADEWQRSATVGDLGSETK